MYGSERLGIFKQTDSLRIIAFSSTGFDTDGTFLGKTSIDTLTQSAPPDTCGIDFYRGDKRFELSNHLGNVLAVISDRKLQTLDAGMSLGHYFSADIWSTSDYYPFGMIMGGRSWSQNSDYRYGFQGQEQDQELYDGAVSYKYRVHDPRIGRFLSIDPLSPKYPHYTPYSFSGNKVIHAIELEGLEEFELHETYDKKGKLASSELVWNESAEPLEGDNLYHLVTYQMEYQDLLVSAPMGPQVISASQYNYEGSYLEPTSVPSSVFGEINYYTWRNQDFVIRHSLMKSGESPPEYYLGYGDKYIRKFTESTRDKLSHEGQMWLDNALLNLQIEMEDGLVENPLLEEDSDLHKAFAFDTHVPAYENAGLLNLSFGDLLIIGTTPSYSDLLSDDGIRQALIVAEDLAKYKALEAGVKTANWVSQQVIESLISTIKKQLNPDGY